MEPGYATSPPMEVCLRPPKVNTSRPGLVQALGADSVSGPCLYLNAAGTIPVPCFAHAGDIVYFPARTHAHQDRRRQHPFRGLTDGP